MGRPTEMGTFSPFVSTKGGHTPGTDVEVLHTYIRPAPEKSVACEFS